MIFKVPSSLNHTMIVHSYKGMLEIEGNFWRQRLSQSPECSVVPLQLQSVIRCQRETKVRKGKEGGKAVLS